MKVLVVGGSGFVGRHLVAQLRDEGHEVESWSRRAGPSRERVTQRRVDLASSEPLPPPPPGGWDAAYQLAAHSLPEGVRGRERVVENLEMTARVLDHLAETAPDCRAIVASSAHVYGDSRAPHVEDEPLAPRGEYGLSKRLCEVWAAARSDALRITIVRSFNQIGPGMPAGLLVPDLLERLRGPLDAPPGGGGARLEMRGRDATRDFLDVRDAARAWVALLGAEAPSGEAFNLCSGRPVRVSELVAALLDRLGLRLDVTFADPAPDTLLGDPSKLRAATGWEARHALEDTVARILEADDG